MSIPSWARVGTRVVRVDAPDPTVGDEHPDRWKPEVGKTYTVRAAAWSSFFGEPFVLLVEYAEAPKPYCDSSVPYEFGFLLRYFRPLITRTQADDIELFRPLLNPSLDELAERNRRQGDEIDAQLERLRSAIRFNNAVEAA